jgi:hypothetical protein
MTMTDDNTTTTTTADNIHRTPKLDAMGLARCRKDNKLFSWRKRGSCKVCGAHVEDSTPASAAAPTVKRKRGGGRKGQAATSEAATPEPTPEATIVTESKRKRSGGRSAKAKK